MSLQRKLNFDYLEFKYFIKRKPWAFLLIILIVLTLTIAMPLLSYYCFTSWACPKYIDDVMLIIGISANLTIILFVLIPVFMGVVLNCLYKFHWPPSSEPPAWAFMSYAEFVARTHG
jgi:hypothetical protein